MNIETVTCSKIQELIKQLPATKLTLAYKMLAELANRKIDIVSPQLDFISLPLDKRRKLMAQQAEQMVVHYEETSHERQEWQSGDFIDEC